MKIFTFAALLFIAACAPSPLYVSRSSAGTPGEVPRDPRGQPIWDKIPAAPPAAKPAPPIAVNPGPPIRHVDASPGGR